MVKEYLSLHVGQCGCQIGKEMWEQLTKEHNLNTYSTTDKLILDKKSKTKNIDNELDFDLKKNLRDNKNAHFYLSDSGKYLARCIFIDTEPRVVNSILGTPLRNVMNPENFFVFPSKSGAGNNWAAGYSLASSSSAEKVFDILEREVENSDSLGGIILTHSISGGTGSGFGSFILEKLSDEYRKIPLITSSVFPSSDSSASDVVVAPYNAILTTKRLNDFADAILSFENGMLTSSESDFYFSQQNKFTNNNLQTKDNISSKPNTSETNKDPRDRDIWGSTGKGFEIANKLVSRSILASTSFSRFSGGGLSAAASSCFEGSLFPLITVPRCNFLTVSQTKTGFHFVSTSSMDRNENITYTHINHDNNKKDEGSRNASDILRRLFKVENFSLPVNLKKGKMLSAVAFLSSPYSSEVEKFEHPYDNAKEIDDLQRGIMKLREKRIVDFVDWTPSNFRVHYMPTSPYLKKNEKSNGIMFSNFSGISKPLKKIISDFEKLKKRNAFIDSYRKIQGDVDIDFLMSEAKENLNKVVEEYETLESPDYLEVSLK